MSNPWIRLYRASLHNPKIVTLSDRQHRAWHNCMLIADDMGALPSMRDVASHLRMSIPDAEQIICELVEAQLIDPVVAKDGRHSYRMHDWDTHQYVSDSSTERSRKHRAKTKLKEPATGMQRCGNGDETATQRPQIQITDTDTESEKITSQPSSAEAAREPAGWQALKSEFNGSTEAMLANIQAWMGPQAERKHAVNWLTGTLTAFGSERTARAWTIVTAKLARGDPVPSPLPLWSTTARGLVDAKKSNDGAKARWEAALARRNAKREAESAHG